MSHNWIKLSNTFSLYLHKAVLILITPNFISLEFFPQLRSSFYCTLLPVSVRNFTFLHLIVKLTSHFQPYFSFIIAFLCLFFLFLQVNASWNYVKLMPIFHHVSFYLIPFILWLVQHSLMHFQFTSQSLSTWESYILCFKHRIKLFLTHLLWVR